MSKGQAGVPVDWSDYLDGMPLGKRPRTLPSDDKPSSSSSPPSGTARSSADMGIKRASTCVARGEWPGFPRGTKFDPSDEDFMWHLLAKVGKGEAEPHPLINEFIISLDEDAGFGYAHPQRLPGVKQDGSVSYFFHRRFKAFNSANPKLQRVQTADLGVLGWGKVGKTKQVIVDGILQGGRKKMVLYVITEKGKRPEKTNWMMHQYHLGTGEDGEGEFVASKIFYQQKYRQSDKNPQDFNMETAEPVVMEGEPVAISLGSKIQEGNQNLDLISVEPSAQTAADHNMDEETITHAEHKELDKCSSYPKEDPKGSEIELIDSQQHVEVITLDDLFQAQSSCAAEAERSTCYISNNALTVVRTLEEGSKECQYGEASTQSSNADSVKDCTSEFTTHEIFKSREEMIKWTRDTGRKNGFVIVIKSSDGGDHGRNRKPRVTFACERGGKYRNMGKKKEEREYSNSRASSSKKCDCPFTLKGNKLATEDDWAVVVVSGVHNHPASWHPEGHSYAGRLSPEENALLVDLSNSLVRPKDILTTLKQRDPLNAATMKTIYNARQRHKLLEKAGRLKIEAPPMSVN